MKTYKSPRNDDPFEIVFWMFMAGLVFLAIAVLCPPANAQTHKKDQGVYIGQGCLKSVAIKDWGKCAPILYVEDGKTRVNPDQIRCKNSVIVLTITCISAHPSDLNQQVIITFPTSIDIKERKKKPGESTGSASH